MEDMKAANDRISVTDWQVCYNSGDGVIAVSCTITSSDEEISGVGLMLNTGTGLTVSSTYFQFGNSHQVIPALNVSKGTFNVGDTVYVVVSGMANDEHFFFEEKMKIVNC
jgi:hypothetical protein